MISTQAKGNIAEKAVQLELERMKPFVQNVIAIANQDDPNHADLIVSLANDYTMFNVQVKHLSESNLSLEMSHLCDWLEAQLLTVPIWWDDATRTAYWADIISYLIRTGGVRGRKNAKFNRDVDLQKLNAGNTESTSRFLKWVRTFSSIWPKLSSPSLDAWILDAEFPVNFIDVVTNPEILAYLPVNAQLINILRAHDGHSKRDISAVTADVFSAGARALTASAHIAAKELAGKYGIPDSDHDVLRELTSGLSRWSERVRSERESVVANKLSAFNQVLSIAAYRGPGDIKSTPFNKAHTYPVRNLLKLLPIDVIGKQLNVILTREIDADLLLSAANYFGVLNWPIHADVWKHVKELRGSIQRRRLLIGPRWKAVYRQLLYTEAQLGSEEAKSEFIRSLVKKDGHHFDAAHVYQYHGGKPELVLQSFESKFEESLRTDVHVIEIQRIEHDQVRKKIRENDPSLTAPRPELWPVD